MSVAPRPRWRSAARASRRRPRPARAAVRAGRPGSVRRVVRADGASATVNALRQNAMASAGTVAAAINGPDKETARTATAISRSVRTTWSGTLDRDQPDEQPGARRGRRGGPDRRARQEDRRLLAHLRERYPGAGVSETHAVWHVWLQDALYVVSDGTEQPLPGIASAERVVSHHAQQGERRPAPHLGGHHVRRTPRRRAVGAGHRGARVVAAEPPDLQAAAAGWAGSSRVTRLAPTGELVEGPARCRTGRTSRPRSPRRPPPAAGSPRSAPAGEAAPEGEARRVRPAVRRSRRMPRARRRRRRGNGSPPRPTPRPGPGARTGGPSRSPARCRSARPPAAGPPRPTRSRARGRRPGGGVLRHRQAGHEHPCVHLERGRRAGDRHQVDPLERVLRLDGRDVVGQRGRRDPRSGDRLGDDRDVREGQPAPRDVDRAGEVGHRQAEVGHQGCGELVRQRPHQVPRGRRELPGRRRHRRSGPDLTGAALLDDLAGAQPRRATRAPRRSPASGGRRTGSHRPA